MRPIRGEGCQGLPEEKMVQGHRYKEQWHEGYAAYKSKELTYECCVI